MDRPNSDPTSDTRQRISRVTAELHAWRDADWLAEGEWYRTVKQSPDKEHWSYDELMTIFHSYYAGMSMYLFASLEMMLEQEQICQVTLATVQDIRGGYGKNQTEVERWSREWICEHRHDQINDLTRDRRRPKPKIERVEVIPLADDICEVSYRDRNRLFVVYSIENDPARGFFEIRDLCGRLGGKQPHRIQMP